MGRPRKVPLRKKPGNFVTLAGLVSICTVLGIIGKFILSGFTFTSNLAEKPYVEKRFEDAVKYTDLKSADMLQKAIDHSDANRQSMMLRMEELNADIRANQATLTTKVDLLLRSMQDIRTDAWNRGHR